MNMQKEIGQKGVLQYTHQSDNTPFLNKEDTKYIQQVVGVSGTIPELLISP